MQKKSENQYGNNLCEFFFQEKNYQRDVDKGVHRVYEGYEHVNKEIGKRKTNFAGIVFGLSVLHLSGI